MTSLSDKCAKLLNDIDMSNAVNLIAAGIMNGNIEVKIIYEC